MVQSMFMHDVVTSVTAVAYFIHCYPLNLSSLTPCTCNKGQFRLVCWCLLIFDVDRWQLYGTSLEFQHEFQHENLT